jgi:hypothetical protein
MGWTATVQLPVEARDFLYSTVSRLPLEPVQPSIQWLLQALFPGVKQPSAKVKIGGAIPPLPHMSSCHGA